MQSRRHASTLRKHAASALAGLLIVAAPMFAKKYPLTAASTVPAAQGQLETGTDKNGNTEIKINVKHLAKPESLTPGRHAYVIWIQKAGGSAENAGTLRVGGKLEGSFKTTTPEKNFDVIITAEDDPGAKTPGGSEVFRGSVRP